MKKVGISTVHTGYNYGSLLQAYATKKILQNLGYDAIVISVSGGIVKGRDVRIKKIFTIIKNLFKQPLNIYKRLSVYKGSFNAEYTTTTKKLFYNFENNCISPVYYHWRDMKRLAKSDEYKAFLCGSDQIWNSEALYVDPQYYLRYVPKEKRIAFAPSFGRDSIAQYNRKKLKKYIGEIPYLSIREKSGVNLIKELTGKSAIHIMDPTLLLEKEDWFRLITNCEKINNYILAYFLNEPSDTAKEVMNILSKEYNLQILALPYHRKTNSWYDDVPSAGPIEFLYYLKNARYVCTDSFHGTAFSINFEISFFTFNRQYGNAGKQSARIVSLLSLLHLETRFNPTEEEIKKNIDFSISNSILKKEREIGINFLRNSLRNIK